LRMKGARHRCHVVPISTVAIACFGPLWASEVTRRTQRKPRFTKLRRKAVQNARSPDGPTSMPRNGVRLRS
jgi:hypothetical protein